MRDDARSPFPVSPLADRIFAVARDHGSAARIVGGAVRDWLVGRPIGDIDMAIAMPIESAAAAFRAAGLRVIETGLAHGTVTVLFAPETTPDTSESIEVTQTRVDVETDGRHAIVVFSPDWAADAARRDFTINAIYLDESSQITDPLGGIADIAARRLRFAGMATDRVREDALRMLRYCRFLPLFGAAAIDPSADAALRAHAGLAAGLSGERIHHELARICAAPGTDVALGLMQDTGLAKAAIGVDIQPEYLACLPPHEAMQQALNDSADLWLLVLSIVLPDGAAGQVATRLRLSRKQARLLAGLQQAGAARAGMASATASDGPVPDSLLADGWRQAAWFLRRDGLDPGLCYAYRMLRQQRRPDPAEVAERARWVPPICPVSGADLLSQGVDKGPALGQMLAAVETRWVQSDFTLSKVALLADCG